MFLGMPNKENILVFDYNHHNEYNVCHLPYNYRGNI